MCIKTKKLFTFLFSTFFCLCLTACNLSSLKIFKPKTYTTDFYGVITYEEFHNGLCVNIPNVGLCTIPSANKIYSNLTEDSNYTLQIGDLVKITFEHENESLAIAESYPGRFIDQASFIVVYAQNVSFAYIQSIYYVDVSWSFTQKRTDTFENSQVGDSVYFIENGGKNGVAYKKLFADAKIGKLDENQISFYFSNDIKIEDFLENYAQLEQSTVWDLH